MNRTRGYIVLAAAVLMQLCLGGIYAWSVFAAPLQRDYGFTGGQTGLIFGTYMCVFTLTVIFVGPLQDRVGPRIPSVVGGLLLAAGYLLAGSAGGRFAVWWLGAGLLTGVAVGFGYVCPIATALKWFPRHKGLVSGIAVAGYGGAAIALTLIGRWLFDAGWDVHRIFRWVGVGYGLVVVAMGLLMFLPPGERARRPREPFRRRVLLTDRRFWLMFMTFFCSAVAGTSVISHLKSIGLWLGNSAGIAEAAVIALAVGNSSGRVLFGFVYDRIGGRRAILLSLAAMAAGVVLLLLAGHSGLGFLAAAVWVGLCYGSNFPIYAPESARLHGVALVGTVYPLVLFAHGLAPMIGPPAVGLLQRLSGSFAPGLLAAAAVTVAGLILYALLTRGRGERSQS
ncbi:MAG: putative MFS-type transporter YhjX [Phycisphaerae bacterium]|nr:putative MFS-type transporter YhjX [Phycisphaerae bacterium]